jgi:hypothetical protein
MPETWSNWEKPSSFTGPTPGSWLKQLENRTIWFSAARNRVPTNVGSVGLRYNWGGTVSPKKCSFAFGGPALHELDVLTDHGIVVAAVLSHVTVVHGLRLGTTVVGLYNPAV